MSVAYIITNTLCRTINNGNEMARPTKFKAEYEYQIIEMAKIGLIDIQIAKVLGVSRQCFDSWKKKYPKLFASIKEAKGEANNKVEQSLYKRAIGIKIKETKKTYDKEGVQIYKTVIEKELPPNEKAAQYWLNNRDSDRWKFKIENASEENSKGIIQKYFESLEN